MDVLRLEHVYWIVGGLLTFLGGLTLYFWLVNHRSQIAKGLSALRSRYVIDYDKLADMPQKSEPAPRPVLTGSYQAEPDSTRTSTPGAEPSNASLTEYLAGLKRLDNPQVWRFSANKIADLVGGTRTDVLTLIREVRAEEEPEPAEPLRVRDSQGERLIAR